MQKNQTETHPPVKLGCYVPDFCQADNNLLLIVVLELIAMVLALASSPVDGSLLIHFALLSVYVQWIGLSSAGLLCVMRRLRWLKDALMTTLLSLVVVGLVTALVSGLAYWINELLHFGLFEKTSILTVMLQHEAIALVLYGLALRYFYIKHNREQMIQIQSQARLQALQARIRPHFLFNSLNTIANLAHEDPDRAETAIENLADLFRASLNADASISLQQEIELTRDYISLEQLRLDDRLRVNWDIQADCDDIKLPALTLQPLVENAIYHGIEPLPDGGEVGILIQQDGVIDIEITNPRLPPSAAARRHGNRMALQNIEERLQLAFQGQAKIEHLVENDLYKVKLRIPKQKPE